MKQVYVKERDMPIGAYENDEIIQQIRNHCEHMIVILSKSFSNSRVNEFFLKYAQWNGIAQNKRKVIPLVYEDCEIPQTLEHCSLLYWLRRETPFFNFWEKLYQSLVEPVIHEVPRFDDLFSASEIKHTYIKHLKYLQNNDNRTRKR